MDCSGKRVRKDYFLRFFRFSTSSSFDISFLETHHTARDIAMMSNIRIARNLVSLKSTIHFTYNGGLTSISQDEVGERQHDSIPPSLIRYSSNPGGISSGSGTWPLIRVTRQVPQVPDNLKHIYFDMCVNQGRSRAVKILQRAANAKGCLLYTYPSQRD